MSHSLFVGGQDACKTFCRGRSGYYVYLLRRPGGQPFYVGKGCGDRVFQHENEARHPNGPKSNSHKLNVVRSIWRQSLSVTYEIDSWHATESLAYAREAELISNLKRLHEGGPLTNRDPGGGAVGGASPFSKARHSATLSGVPEDNPERAALNQFVLAVGPMDSVVIKPAKQFTAKPTQKYPSKVINLRQRTAIAIVAAAAAQGVQIVDGAVIARRVEIDGVEGLLENGVCCDLLTASVVDIEAAPHAADERLRIRPGMASKIIGLIGKRKVVELGVCDDSL